MLLPFKCKFKGGGLRPTAPFACAAFTGRVFAIAGRLGAACGHGVGDRLFGPAAFAVGTRERFSTFVASGRLGTSFAGGWRWSQQAARSHWQEAGLSGDDLDERMGILVVPDVAAGTALNQDAEKVDKQGYLLNKLQYAITAVLERAKAAALVKRYGCSLPRADSYKSDSG